MTGEQIPGFEGVFVGSFMHSLDPKKRLTIPSDWREQVGDPTTLYVLPGVDEECLSVLPAREMSRRLDKIRRHSITDKKARHFARVLASRSDLVSFDSQGRIRVKDELLAFADLKDQVMLVGTFEGFELWSPDRWKSSGGSDKGSLEDAAAYVGF